MSWHQALAMVIAAGLAGCAGTAIDESYQGAQRFSQAQWGAELRWLTTDDARRQARADVRSWLAEPLAADVAVRVALAHSPALQALLYESAAESADATQMARVPNPVLALERMVRQASGAREVELTQVLSVSLLDLILLPARQRLAGQRQQAVRLSLMGGVADAAMQARQAWVEAVAAQQRLRYVEQVKAAADAGAELARRMQAVGNFSRLQRAREQSFSADAVAQLARAQQNARASREALVRALGLDADLAERLRLPERLPDLPPAPRGEEDVAQAASAQRLDLQLARHRLDAQAHAHGLAMPLSVMPELNLGLIRQRETGQSPRRGVDIELALPVFDSGDAGRAQSQAALGAALARWQQARAEAESQLREQYGGYRTAYDLARHMRDEVVPLRKTIAEENLYLYNGMFISVFDLLADAREQIAAVVTAIDTQRDFWLADARLQAALLGRPIAASGGDGLFANPPRARGAVH